VAAALTALRRDPTGEPVGALILLHGRGADEHDLYPLLDTLDPERRLVGYTPRGPLALSPGGAHWYRLGGIPTPDPETFWSSYRLLADWLDALPFGPERLVLGGFSQGCVMAWALGLTRERPRPAGLVQLSGFLPRVEGLELVTDGLAGRPVAIAHGSLDPVIPVEWSREARRLVEAGGADLLYRESPLPHTIDPRILPELAELVRQAIP
jgi:phospholipase/carboxylesterase